MNSDKLRITINGEIIECLQNSINDSIDAHYEKYVNNIVNYTINSMVECMISKQFDSVIHQLEIQRRSRNKVKKTLRNKNNQSLLMIYNLGKYDGVYSTMAEMIEKTVSQNQLDEIYNQLIAKKHLINIIIYVYENPLVHHKNICDAIGVKANYLSELMTTLNKYGLINKYSFSKYTNYSLTEKGKKIYELNRKNITVFNHDKIKSLKQKEMEYKPMVINSIVIEKNNSFENYDTSSFKKNNSLILYTKNL